MTTKIINYSSNITIVADLSALGTSSTFTGGVESNEIDNTSDKYIDAQVHGSFIVGTTPNIPSQFNVYAWGANVPLSSVNRDTLDGVASAETLANASVLISGLRIASVSTILAAISDKKYDITPFSVSLRLGLIGLPKYWGLFFAHNMGVALKTDSGNTNAFSFVGIKFDDIA